MNRLDDGARQVLSTGSGISLLFRFNAPDDLPEADTEQSENYYFWHIKFVSNLRGADLNHEFNRSVLISA